MNLPEFAVRRPLTVFMVFIAVLLFGALALLRLPVDLMPSFEVPVVSVVTLYPGASSQDVESNVTEILEDSFSTISGVDKVTSVSQTGLSAIMVEFEWGTDLNEASSDVRDVLDMLASMLPDDIETPMLMKMSSTNIPILMFGVTAEENFEGLRHIVQEQIADPLKAVPGVAEVMALGGPEREIQILIDPGKLGALGIPIDQVVQVLSAENLDIPTGNVKLGWTEYAVRVPGRFESADQLGDIVVGQSMGKLIHLRDIAEVRDGFAEQRMKARADRTAGVVFFVSKQAGTNSVTVSSAALERLDELERDLPPDVKLFKFFDTSEFISKALRNLRQALIYGAIGVIVVVLMFLRRFRSTIVIGLTIPAALMASLFVMYVAGYTINMVSLMSLAIAIGMVVDAAVVVLENVTRHVESGERVREASIYAPGEIGQALFASTLTTIVVFVPMLFITNVTGVLFKQMALVVIVSIAMSLFAALTLTPALSSTLMRGSFDDDSRRREKNRFFRAGEEVFARVEERYGRVLEWALGHKKRTVFGALGIFVISLALLPFVKTEFFPSPDSGEIEMVVELAPGTKIDRTMEVLGKIEGFMEREVPERDYMYSYAGETGSGWAVIQGEKEGTHIGRVGVQLVDKEFRDRSSQEVGDEIREFAKSLPSVVKISLRTGSSIAQFMTGGGGAPISIQVRGDDIDELEDVAVEIRDMVRGVEGAVDVELDLGDPKPEFHVVIDRERAAALGLNTYMIASALRSQIYGVEATKLRQGGNQWEVVVRAPEDERSDVEDILSLPIPSVTGEMVRLSSVADVEIGSGPTEIRRLDQERVVRIEGRITDRVLGEVSADIGAGLDEISVPPGVSVDFGGEVQEQQEAFADLGLLLLLAIALVYMVMSSQFENLLDPFVVMFSVPFAFVGVIWAFLITNTTLSMTSFLGVIMLMGIVVNNAIVLVDYTNILRKRGMDLTEAIMTAGNRRLRPVLMTAFTTIFGMLPLALMQATGAEVWRPLGVTMVGGLLVSTVVTLVLVPTIYSIFEARLRRNARWSR
ncbi:MAG: MMPL family transporter [Candidatus Eisenbacteria bacterium]|nr:MMPL family transporter [Candidatus Eisenbacteria bacterium]